LLSLVAILVLFGVFLASITFVEFTASSTFCSSCHVMKPEVTVYRNSPHSRVECGVCHRGPGAWALVKIEMANARYLWVYPLGLYERPIPSPVHNLRPVEIVCEQCHWPEIFYEDRLRILSDYDENETNSLTRTAILLKTGGGRKDMGLGRGIHWHIENPVWYIATDEKRQEIPWIRAEFEGVITDYTSPDSPLTPEEIFTAEKRLMDCVDCHNRATHVFRRPAKALDDALASGAIPSDLPFIKEKAREILEGTYDTEEDAAKAIVALGDYYRDNYPDIFQDRKEDVEKTLREVQSIFDETQFPFMGVTWQTHPNNIGHREFPGCFRCHDGRHISRDNEAVRLECNICHSIPQVADTGKTLPDIRIEAEEEPESHFDTQWLAEHSMEFDDTCANCHNIENAGEADNSGFCSNSACHGSEWQFMGLD
jgi:hypothetical protein